MQQVVRNTEVFSDETARRKAAAKAAATAVQVNKAAALIAPPNKVDDGMGTKIVGKKRKMSEASNISIESFSCARVCYSKDKV